MLVHVPLTKMSAAFSFCTAFTAWLIDNKTKMQIYESCQSVVNFVSNPKSTINRKKMAQTFTMDMPGNSQVSTQRLSKKSKARLKNVVDWVVLNLFIFASILLNFLYTTFLQDAMVSIYEPITFLCIDDHCKIFHQGPWLHWFRSPFRQVPPYDPLRHFKYLAKRGNFKWIEWKGRLWFHAPWDHYSIVLRSNALLCSTIQKTLHRDLVDSHRSSSTCSNLLLAEHRHLLPRCSGLGNESVHGMVPYWQCRWLWTKWLRW